MKIWFCRIKSILKTIIQRCRIVCLNIRLALFKILNLRHDREAALDFAFKHLNRPIFQVREEISGLMKILEDKNPKVVLEIGTANGGSLFLLAHSASEDAVVIGVDLPGGPFGGECSQPCLRLIRSFKRGKQKIFLVRSDSHRLETLSNIEDILDGRKIDVLFIDGDHSYEGVKKDYEMYRRLVEKDGIIIFHDIVPGADVSVGGVPQFWNKIKRGYRYKEIVKDWNRGKFGIGVLYLRPE